ncbi:MAG: hypothetical protein NTZ78_13125 [Candidatus Aureabacteria bacterium]|nr:hypothetical protein [Candidatus Auribacterota bacterium]
MFVIDEIVVYKGHGLVKVVGMPKKKLSELHEGAPGEEAYYVLRSPRTPLMGTKLMVRVEGAERVLRYPMTAEQAKKVIEVMGEESSDLPEDHKERMQIMESIVEKNDVNESASLVRDYRESKLLNLERDEINRIKAIARNIAEELCYILRINRTALHGKFSIRTV